MLKLSELELIQLLRTPGGADFVDFCNKVIRATCWAYAIPQSEVSTTARTDAKDGGVDTRVALGIPGERSGYFEAPSAWQFKAADEGNVTAPKIRKEVLKPYARKCIESGDAYRICICAHLTVRKRQSLTKALEMAVNKVNPSAPAPKVLSLDDLVTVANFYPALVMTFRPGLEGLCILFERFRERARSVTPDFVAPSTFALTKSAVSDHASFSRPVRDAVIALHGLSGVGKTRSLYEFFGDQPGAESFVLYSDNEDKLDELTNILVNDESFHAIVLADECSLETRVRLSRRLTPCQDRVRCVCVENSNERPSGAAPEFAVKRPDAFELEKILKANFPHIPDDRLRAYARFSEGFVRIAADICAYYDEKIQQAGNMSPIAGKLKDYYRERLDTEAEQTAVEAISLLARVRYKGKTPNELDLVCQITGLDRRKVEQSLDAVRDAPGFVERGELYYRVTPHLIGSITFEGAWKRWADRDPDKFLRSIPEEIQESFLERVSEIGTTEVREIVRNFFLRFAESLTSANLTDLSSINKLGKLIDTDPETYLPFLQRLVASATHEELTCSPEWIHGSWGPRRQLCWISEQFAQFPEFFTASEDILYVLATHECEQNLSNNATHTWQQLFRMTLSGTSLPLSTRLEILRRRLAATTENTADLFAGALEEILYVHASRIVGPPVVAGRLVPAEWNPTAQEYKDVVISALQFILEACQHHLPSLAQKAKMALFHDIDSLVRRGWLDLVKPIVTNSHLDENDRARLTSNLKGISAWGKHPEGTRLTDEYSRKIDDWISELLPRSLHGRLVEAIAAPSWDHFGRENDFQSAITALATTLFENRSALENEFDWLTSTDPKSTFELGYALGSLDSAGLLLSLVVGRSLGREAGLARGYTAGLLYGASADSGPVNDALDALEIQDPAFAFQIALAGGQKVHVFDRTIRLIRTDRLPVYALRNFIYWVGTVATTNEQVAVALETLLPRAQSGDRNSSDAITDFLGMRLHSEQYGELLSKRPDLVWDCLKAFAENPGREAFWWGKAIQSAAPSDPKGAIQVACKALVGDSFEVRDEASKLLGLWAVTYPNEVMSEVASLMLDPTSGVMFFLRKFPVFTALPVEVVTSWLEKAGPEAAQKIARHLPAPHIDARGEPTVPELTAWVLTKFEDDDRVFHEFCAGVHSYQMYMGDIAAAHEGEAERARRFFDHGLRRIREWARSEYKAAKRLAGMQREMEDEMNP